MVCRLFRERYHELGELALAGVHANSSLVLLHHDLVAERQPQPRARSCRLGGEERIENLLQRLLGNPSAVIADANLDRLAGVARHHAQDWPERVSALQALLVGRVESVVSDIQENAA